MYVKNFQILFKFMFSRKNGGIEKYSNSFAAAPSEKIPPLPPLIHQAPSKISTISQSQPIEQSIMMYPEVFTHIGICISTVYLCGTKGHLTWLGLMLEKCFRDYNNYICLK